MNYDVETIKRALRETEAEKNLKSYLNQINNICGEDYAILIFTSAYDIRDSINKYSSKFSKIYNSDVEFLLLKSALLSNDNDADVIDVKKNIENGNYYLLLTSIEKDLRFRKNLSRILINQVNKSNIKLLKENNNKKETIDNLLKLKDYERYIKVQGYLQEHDRTDYKKVYKKRKRKQ